MRNLLSILSGLFSRKVAAGAGAASSIALAVAIAVPEIKSWEGRSLVAYRDMVGIWTICDGETLGVKAGDRATPVECDQMTEARANEFERAIRPCLPDDLPPKTRAAFIVNAYNIGKAGFCGSSASRYAKAGNLSAACNSLMAWNKATFSDVGAANQRKQGQTCSRKADGKFLCTVRGLTLRRTAERELCLAGLK